MSSYLQAQAEKSGDRWGTMTSLTCCLMPARAPQGLVHEATYTEEMAQKAGDVGHSYAKLVATFAESVQLPNLVLMQFSPATSSTPMRRLPLRRSAKRPCAFTRARFTWRGILANTPWIKRATFLESGGRNRFAVFRPFLRIHGY